MKKLFLVSILSFTITIISAQEIRLAYKGTVGETYQYNYIAKLHMEMKVDPTISRGKKMPVVDVVLSKLYDVTVVHNVLPQDALMAEIKLAKCSVEYTVDDKAVPPGPVLAKLSELQALPVTVAVTPQGTIVDIYGVEALPKKLFPKLKDKRQMEYLTDRAEAEYKVDYNRLLPIFPQKKVVCSEDWHNTLAAVELPYLAPAPLATDYRYVFKGTSTLNGKPCSLITMTMEFAPVKYGPETPANSTRFSLPKAIPGKPARLDLKSYGGKLFFDHRAGKLRKTENKAEMVLGLEMPPDDEQLLGYWADLEITLIESFELIEKGE